MRTNASGLAPFETDRLIGREWSASDAQAAFAIYGDAEVMRGLCAPPEASLESQAASLERAVEKYREMAYGTGFWALERKIDKRIVGAAIVKPIPKDEEKVEVGWQLAREYWGQGYASEGAGEAVRIAFRNLPIDRIFALVLPWNERSLRVARRLGFRRGELTAAYYSAELIVHTLAKRDWELAICATMPTPQTSTP
jgi:RimJ/RimL family protein N-acetyltransferase